MNGKPLDSNSEDPTVQGQPSDPGTSDTPETGQPAPGTPTPGTPTPAPAVTPETPEEPDTPDRSA
jgi:hypothetical protein